MCLPLQVWAVPPEPLLVSWDIQPSAHIQDTNTNVAKLHNILLVLSDCVKVQLYRVQQVVNKLEQQYVVMPLGLGNSLQRIVWKNNCVTRYHYTADSQCPSMIQCYRYCIQHLFVVTHKCCIDMHEGTNLWSVWQVSHMFTTCSHNLCYRITFVKLC